MSLVSVRLSKQEQVQQRRTEVLELSSRGLTQQEIADRLGPFHISQRTVSRDLEWLGITSLRSNLSCLSNVLIFRAAHTLIENNNDRCLLQAL
jgi:DNA-binding CsgD family transcriptional regulator